MTPILSLVKACAAVEGMGYGRVKDTNQTSRVESNTCVQAALYLEEGQAEQLLVTRRTVLRELGALFAEREQMLARLQVRLCAAVLSIPPECFCFCGGCF